MKKIFMLAVAVSLLAGCAFSPSDWENDALVCSNIGSFKAQSDIYQNQKGFGWMTESYQNYKNGFEVRLATGKARINREQCKFIAQTAYQNKMQEEIGRGHVINVDPTGGFSSGTSTIGAPLPVANGGSFSPLGSDGFKGSMDSAKREGIK